MNDTFSLPQEYRSGLAVTAGQQKVIEDILKSTLEKIPAKFILLVDSSGQLVNVVGDTGNIETAALGSLIAADIAASQGRRALSSDYRRSQPHNVLHHSVFA
jgi:hypothetical protein